MADSPIRHLSREEMHFSAEFCVYKGVRPVPHRYPPPTPPPTTTQLSLSCRQDDFRCFHRRCCLVRYGASASFFIPEPQAHSSPPFVGRHSCRLHRRRRGSLGQSRRGHRVSLSRLIHHPLPSLTFFFSPLVLPAKIPTMSSPPPTGSAPSTT